MLFLLLVGELIVFNVLLPGYMSPGSLLDTSRTFVETGVLALRNDLRHHLWRGIDLSVASLLALVSVVIGLSYDAGLPLPAAMLLGLATGIAGGLLNGAAVAYLGLHPFVVTLAHHGDLPRRRIRDFERRGGVGLSALGLPPSGSRTSRTGWCRPSYPSCWSLQWLCGCC